MPTEIKTLVKKKLNITYNDRHVARILRSFKMHYTKPYPRDYRQPENPAEQLKQVIEKEIVGTPKNSVIEFLDEVSPQTINSASGRLASYESPRIYIL